MRARAEVIDDDRLGTLRHERVGECASRLVVPRAVAGGQDQDARHRALSYPASALARPPSRRVPVHRGEVAQRRLQRLGHAIQTVDGDRLLSALDFADELAAQAGAPPERPLSVAEVLAERAHAPAQDDADFLDGSTAHRRLPGSWLARRLTARGAWPFPRWCAWGMSSSSERP